MTRNKFSIKKSRDSIDIIGKRVFSIRKFFFIDSLVIDFFGLKRKPESVFGGLFPKRKEINFVKAVSALLFISTYTLSPISAITLGLLTIGGAYLRYTYLMDRIEFAARKNYVRDAVIIAASGLDRSVGSIQPYDEIYLKSQLTKYIKKERISGVDFLNMYFELAFALSNKSEEILHQISTFENLIREKYPAAPEDIISAAAVILSDNESLPDDERDDNETERKVSDALNSFLRTNDSGDDLLKMAKESSLDFEKELNIQILEAEKKIRVQKEIEELTPFLEKHSNYKEIIIDEEIKENQVFINNKNDEQKIIALSPSQKSEARIALNEFLKDRRKPPSIVPKRAVTSDEKDFDELISIITGKIEEK